MSDSIQGDDTLLPISTQQEQGPTPLIEHHLKSFADGNASDCQHDSPNDLSLSFKDDLVGADAHPKATLPPTSSTQASETKDPVAQNKAKAPFAGSEPSKIHSHGPDSNNDMGHFGTVVIDQPIEEHQMGKGELLPLSKLIRFRSRCKEYIASHQALSAIGIYILCIQFTWVIIDYIQGI